MRTRLPLALFALCCSAPAAALYKCVDADGNVTFTQAACAATDKVSEIALQTEQFTIDPRACELATLFAEDVAARMRRGGDYGREMDRYGGAFNAKPAIVGVVNYVYSFRLNQAAPPSRIASLAASKCRNGGFGRIAFEDLPVDEYYYFDPVNQTWIRHDAPGAPPQPGRPAAAQEPAAPRDAPESGSHRQSGTPAGAREPAATWEAALPTDLRDRPDSGKSECDRLRQQLQALDDQMRSGYADSEGDSLRGERRDLRSRIFAGCR